ncbi:MAG TPA: glycosyltransferase family 4 protein [Gaiellales bacterium]
MAVRDVSGLRIAVVCPYAMDVPGGVQQHAHGLAAHLREGGAAVTLLAPGRHSPQGAEFASIGAARAFPDNGSVTRTVIAPWALARLGRRLRRGYDIVHVHEPMLPPSLAAIAATSAPVVGTFHMASADARWYRRFGPVVRRARRRIDGAIAVSPQARAVACRPVQRPVVDREPARRRSQHERPEADDDDARHRPDRHHRPIADLSDVPVGQDVADVRQHLSHQAADEPGVVRLGERALDPAVVRDLADQPDRAGGEDDRDPDRDQQAATVDPERAVGGIDAVLHGDPSTRTGRRTFARVRAASEW